MNVEIKPADSRCKYWAKIVRAESPLPSPEQAQGADDIPAPYLRKGDEELAPGDLLFEGEANHHRRTDRGWSYWLTWVAEDGSLRRVRNPDAAMKEAVRPSWRQN